MHRCSHAYQIGITKAIVFYDNRLVFPLTSYDEKWMRVISESHVSFR